MRPGERAAAPGLGPARAGGDGGRFRKRIRRSRAPLGEPPPVSRLSSTRDLMMVLRFAAASAVVAPAVARTLETSFCLLPGGVAV